MGFKLKFSKYSVLSIKLVFYLKHLINFQGGKTPKKATAKSEFMVNLTRKIRKAVFQLQALGHASCQQLRQCQKNCCLLDKPLIQYAAEEAIASGIDTLVFVTGRNKRAIEDHFDTNQGSNPLC